MNEIVSLFKKPIMLVIFTVYGLLKKSSNLNVKQLIDKLSKNELVPDLFLSTTYAACA